MKKLIFVTMLLHVVCFARSQNIYADAPEADLSEVQGFTTFENHVGKLNNYGDLFKTTLIKNLFPGENQSVKFNVYYQASKNASLHFVAYGTVRTVFRFSTWIKEPGIYYCKFGTSKLIKIDASNNFLKIQLQKIKKQ